MPRDPSGNYGLPIGYRAETGQTILASQHNPPLEDIADALTGSLARNGSAPMGAPLPMGNFRITGLSPGTAPTDAATFAQVGAAAPPGIVVDYAGATAPTGWLLCDGSAVSRTTYAALFSAIGTLYGVGDGTTTFKVPDLRGRLTVGKDNMGGTAANRVTVASGVAGTTLGAVGGAQTVALTEAQNGPHTHPFSGTTNNAGSHAHGIPTGFSAGSNAFAPDVAAIGTVSTTSAGDHTHPFSGTTASAGSGTAHTNMPPAIVTNKIIKV